MSWHVEKCRPVQYSSVVKYLRGGRGPFTWSQICLYCISQLLWSLSCQTWSVPSGVWCGWAELCSCRPPHSHTLWWVGALWSAPGSEPEERLMVLTIFINTFAAERHLKLWMWQTIPAGWRQVPTSLTNYLTMTVQLKYMLKQICFYCSAFELEVDRFWFFNADTDYWRTKKADND